MTNTIEKTPAQQAVAAGVTFLNEARPGWREWVDTDTLDLSDSRNCVLGQVFWREALGYCCTPFTAGTWALADYMEKHGYSADDMPEMPTVMFGFERDGQEIRSYEELDYEWQQVLAS